MKHLHDFNDFSAITVGIARHSEMKRLEHQDINCVASLLLAAQSTAESEAPLGKQPRTAAPTQAPPPTDQPQAPKPISSCSSSRQAQPMPRAKGCEVRLALLPYRTGVVRW